jgi:hypothetical protein
MQPSWIPGTDLPPEVASALIAQCASLLQRIVGVERALATREWWLLGRAVPEAGQIAEVASLLAVAHGELEQALAEYFDWRLPWADGDTTEDEDDFAPLYRDPTNDPAWLRGRQDEANGLLRTLGLHLPAMQSFAEQLLANAAGVGMPVTALDALGIVQDRLGEALDALRGQVS